MAVELGKNIFIYSGTSGTTALIAGAKSCTISKSCEVREKASATSATAREFVFVGDPEVNLAAVFQQQTLFLSAKALFQRQIQGILEAYQWNIPSQPFLLP